MKNNIIELGDWETEIEAAQAYNIGTFIFSGIDGEFNDVPTPSIETFNGVIKRLKRQGWSCSDGEMRYLKNMLRIHFGMDFKADA